MEGWDTDIAAQRFKLARLLPLTFTDISVPWCYNCLWKCFSELFCLSLTRNLPQRQVWDSNFQYQHRKSSVFVFLSICSAVMMGPKAVFPLSFYSLIIIKFSYRVCGLSQVSLLTSLKHLCSWDEIRSDSLSKSSMAIRKIYRYLFEKKMPKIPSSQIIYSC